MKNLSNDPILCKWVNPLYLHSATITELLESVKAKPVISYLVLDNFFNEEPLEELIDAHQDLEFSERQDRQSHDGQWLPYDGAVNFASPNHVGGELFFHKLWHQYCAAIVGTKLTPTVTTEIKLRYHRPYADGFWIHTDSTIRTMVTIAYFNKEWTLADGGLLQLWRVDECRSPSAFKIESPNGRLDFLTQHQRIATSTPGGGFPDRQPHDLVLIDQIVPVYNRVFFCNFQGNPAYHSVTPSGPRERLGFVQWLSNR